MCCVLWRADVVAAASILGPVPEGINRRMQVACSLLWGCQP